MGYLLRKIGKPGVWIGAVADLDDHDFPVSIIADLLGRDSKGVSFWKVSDPKSADVQRLIAGLAVTGLSKFEQIVVRFLKFNKEDLGDIEIDELPGTIIDNDLKGLHVNLHIKTCPQAIRVAKLMLAENARSFSAQQVANLVADSVADGNFTLKDANRDFLKSLYDEGRLVVKPG